MLIEINTRGNGACPICTFTGNCNIQETLKKTLEEFSSDGTSMEIVIFTCPKFIEKV
jgi:hypothetical protein